MRVISADREVMFYYFGRKGRLAPSYPNPAHPLVIEPFAGSMAYTLHHQPNSAMGFEIDSTVVKVWNQIAGLTPDEIIRIPAPRIGERTDDRWSMMAAGSHGTARASSYLWTDRMARDFEKQKRLALRHLDYVQEHVAYVEGDYTEAPNRRATWFIDPPYQHVERGYERGGLDYDDLGRWCRTRKGQVIVCEQEGATWLPFVPLRTIRGTTNKITTEVVWVGGA